MTIARGDTYVWAPSRATAFIVRAVRRHVEQPDSWIVQQIVSIGTRNRPILPSKLIVSGCELKPFEVAY